jgi:hypothetical protein
MTHNQITFFPYNTLELDQYAYTIDGIIHVI